jgi:large subunit ribosomal protein L29
VNRHNQELRAKSPAELLHLLNQTQDELATLRFQLANRQSTNQARLAIVRREIARLKTLLREDQLRRMA